MNDNKGIIEIDNKNAFRLESFVDYNSNRVYGLVALTKGGETWYPVYVFPSRYDKEIRGGVPDTGKKARPVSLRLGVGKKAALENLDKIKKMLELI